ncbi:TerB family tellurite resistance protein [Tropicimonas sp. TH_r6]|uniref:TerB family tellurite resistance protein n=1 Tax=Tropicimonas sp. TH_r6 TaxID=3082085 RepID=UPI002954FB6C|nr:TerB family tellurite resistance protein [Tropicimonas sp. TH_r6]MDV7141751.1 TerB family tellurite resistance protein [Tropicimonas sp. TH_r6]
MIKLSEEQQVLGFDCVQSVLANEERFKIRLKIGRDAFTSLKTGERLGHLFHLGTAAGAGAGAAASGTVATTFFGSIWTSVGLATAATPVGWIVGAAVASGGFVYGVSRLFQSYSNSRVDEIPKFLNSALDIMAASTLDLLGSLAMKVASIDGHVDQTERNSMQEYFVDEWGYDPTYVEQALNVLEQNIEKTRLSEMTASLAEFAKSNPDCDFGTMQAGLRELLVEIAEADGHLDEREEMAIERIEASLCEQNSLLYSVKAAVSATASGVSSASETLGKSATGAVSRAVSAFRGASGRLRSKGANGSGHDD